MITWRSRNLIRALPFLGWILLSLQASCSGGGVPRDEGSISGVVRFEGKVPDAKEYNWSNIPDAVASYPGGIIKVRPIVVNADSRVQWALVAIVAGLDNTSHEVPKEYKVLTLNNMQYSPRVLGIQSAQELRISTDLKGGVHDAHAHTNNNPEFNAALMPGSPETRVRFEKEEPPFIIKCNIHSPCEFAYVAVFNHPFFSVTNETGGFKINGLRPGKYVLRAWQENCTPVEQEVIVGGGSQKVADFVLKQSTDRN